AQWDAEERPAQICELEGMMAADGLEVEQLNADWRNKLKRTHDQLQQSHQKLCTVKLQLCHAVACTIKALFTRHKGSQAFRLLSEGHIQWRHKPSLTSWHRQVACRHLWSSHQEDCSACWCTL
ncbi:hypothetical protein PAXRUDRAFT_829890, partial [Paxillus rubicundulus Ve08.2h10]